MTSPDGTEYTKHESLACIANTRKNRMKIRAVFPEWVVRRQDTVIKMQPFAAREVFKLLGTAAEKRLLGDGTAAMKRGSDYYLANNHRNRAKISMQYDGKCSLPEVSEKHVAVLLIDIERIFGGVLV